MVIKKSKKNVKNVKNLKNVKGKKSLKIRKNFNKIIGGGSGASEVSFFNTYRRAQEPLLTPAAQKVRDRKAASAAKLKLVSASSLFPEQEQPFRQRSYAIHETSPQKKYTTNTNI